MSGQQAPPPRGGECFRHEEDVLGHFRRYLRHEASQYGLERFANEANMLEVVRQHLRHAKREEARGELVFRVKVKQGGPTGFWVGLTSEYEFEETLGENGSPR